MPYLEPTYLLSQEIQVPSCRYTSLGPSSCPMKCKQEASCECLTWSPPSDSCLSWTRDEPSGVVEASLWQQHTNQMGPLASTLSTRTSRVSTSLPTTEDVWLVGGMNMGSRAGTGIHRNNNREHPQRLTQSGATPACQNLVATCRTVSWPRP